MVAVRVNGFGALDFGLITDRYAKSGGKMYASASGGNMYETPRIVFEW